MYYLDDAKSTSFGQLPLESSLNELVRINPIRNLQNCIPTKKICNNLEVKNRKEKINASQKPYKGKLSKSSFRSIRQDIENKEKELQSKRDAAVKNQSTLEFINRLKNIEKPTENCSFLDQTKEEIDVASKQLEEIQKLLSDNMLKLFVSEVNKNKAKPPERIRKDEFHQQSCKKKVNKQFERLHTQYVTKTKMYYKSLKHFENLTNNSKTFVKNDTVDRSDNNSNAMCQTKSVPPPLDKKKQVSFDNLPQSVNLYDLTNTSNSDVNQEINPTYKAKNNSSKFLNKRKRAQLETRLEDLMEEIDSPKDEEKEDSSSSELECNDEFNNIFFSNNGKETVKKNFNFGTNNQRKDGIVKKIDPKESLLNNSGICMADILKNTVLKSEYLSKEFCADFPNKSPKVDKEEKKSIQLLETTQRKFQPSCQLTNLKRRDQKLYTTLNMALKNTLYGKVEQ